MLTLYYLGTGNYITTRTFHSYTRGIYNQFPYSMCYSLKEGMSFDRMFKVVYLHTLG